MFLENEKVYTYRFWSLQILVHVKFSNQLRIYVPIPWDRDILRLVCSKSNVRIFDLGCILNTLTLLKFMRYVEFFDG